MNVNTMDGESMTHNHCWPQRKANTRRPVNRLIVAALVVGLVPAAAIPTWAQSAGSGELAPAIEKLLAGQHVRKMRVGLHIVRLSDGAALFSHNPAEPLMPASNLKLVTTWAALHTLGPTFEFETVLALRGDDLIVFGSGDPALGDPKLTSRAGVSATWMFDRWVAALKTAGISQYQDLIIDDSIFEPPAAHPNWPADQLLRWYCAQVGGLNFHTNCLDVWTTREGSAVGATVRPATDGFVQIVERLSPGRTAKEQDRVSLLRPVDKNTVTITGVVKRGLSSPVSITIDDPGLFAGHALAAHLKANGIRQAGTVRRSRERDAELQIPPGCQVLAVFRTPVADAVARSNQQSQNLFAECLFKAVGAYAPDGKPVAATTKSTDDAALQHKPRAVGSWASGRAAVGAALMDVGVPADQFVLDDGCGLSRENRLTASMITHLLADAIRSPWAEVWVATLARSGEPDTTIAPDKRAAFSTPALRGNVFAKTGFINGVSCLSGYVRSDDEWVAFSILCNTAKGSTWAARGLQDEVVTEIGKMLSK